MTPTQAGITTLGFTLQSLLITRCVYSRAYLAYPFFFIYLTVSLARFALFMAVDWGLLYGDFATFFWSTSLPVSFLRFLVCWDVFRHAFLLRTAVRGIAAGVLVVVLLFLFSYFAFAEDGATSYPEMERKVSLTVAVWLLVVLGSAMYYSVPLTRPVWGMAAGMGLYASISLMNFSALGLLKRFLPVLGWIRSIDFILLMAIWNWALWSYKPEGPSHTPPHHISQNLLLQWNQQWSNIRAKITKAVGL